MLVLPSHPTAVMRVVESNGVVIVVDSARIFVDPKLQFAPETHWGSIEEEVVKHKCVAPTLSMEMEDPLEMIVPFGGSNRTSSALERRRRRERRETNTR
jgi:hypothetical protein